MKKILTQTIINNQRPSPKTKSKSAKKRIIKVLRRSSKSRIKILVAKRGQLTNPRRRANINRRKRGARRTFV